MDRIVPLTAGAVVLLMKSCSLLGWSDSLTTLVLSTFMSSH